MLQTHSSNLSKVHLISLGCARNRVDSEVMLASLLGDGYVYCEEAAEADVVIVNTCGFIGPAKDESIETILEVATLKQDCAHLKIVVSGCLTQRYKRQLAQGLPEVDLFVGTDEFIHLPQYLRQLQQGLLGPSSAGEAPVLARRTRYLYDGHLGKQNTLSPVSAYVKIAEGCQHSCAFCIIPAIRGPLRSRPLDHVVQEVQRLAEQGVKEINLIAQDLAAYGRDFKEATTQRHDKALLQQMLTQLAQVEGIEWIRLLYMYPEYIDDVFLEFMAGEEKIVPYLDIPVQHGSDAVLRRMKRQVTREQILQTIDKVRCYIPDMAVRTSVMVGFPGETDAEFKELLSLVQEARFDHLGCFTYSREEGTVAARFPDQVAEEVKQERLEQVMLLQQQISTEIQKEKIGNIYPILVNGPSKETPYLYEGRIWTQAPEVDGVTYINAGDIKPYSLQYAKITDAESYDLVAEIVESK